MNKVKSKLRIQVDPSAIIRNITNFFGDELACIPELLQNCRRAEANQVNVIVDFKASTFTVEDNGHGVMDPTALLTIGKSDWSSKTVAEMPAGMGLFSSFKIGSKLTVESGNWHMTIDFAKRQLDDAVSLEYERPRRTGAKVTIHFDQDKLLAATGRSYGTVADKIGELVDQLHDTASFMPFSTQITVKNPSVQLLDSTLQKCTKVPAFEPWKLPVIAEVKTPWGKVFFLRREDRKLPLHDIIHEDGGVFVSQGVAFALKQLDISFDYTDKYGQSTDRRLATMLIVAEPGTVDFSLPDRDKILDNAKRQRVVADMNLAMFEALTTALTAHNKTQPGFPLVNSDAYELLRTFAELFPDRRAVLPSDLHFLIDDDRRLIRPEPHNTLVVEAIHRHDGYAIARNLTTNTGLRAICLENRAGYQATRKNRPYTKDEEYWAAQLFPKTFLASSLELGVQCDPRSDHLLRVVSAKLRSDTASRELELAVCENEAVFVEDAPDIAAFDERDDVGEAVVLQACDAKTNDKNIASDHLVLHTYAPAAPIDGEVTFVDEDNVRHVTDDQLEESEADNGAFAWYSSPAYFAIEETRGQFPASFATLIAFTELLQHKLPRMSVDKMSDVTLDMRYDGFTIKQAVVYAQARRHNAFPIEPFPGVYIRNHEDTLVVKVASTESEPGQLAFSDARVESTAADKDSEYANPDSPSEEELSDEDE